MLDTSVAIPMRDGDVDVLNKVEALGGPYLLSAITRVELEGGVYSDPTRTAGRRLRLDRLLENIPVVAFDDAAAATYGQIVKRAGYSRRKIVDRMIASQAILQQVTFVTLNARDFADIPGLVVLAL